MPHYISRKEFGELCGVSNTMMSRWVRQGRFGKIGEPPFDPYSTKIDASHPRCKQVILETTGSLESLNESMVSGLDLPTDTVELATTEIYEGNILDLMDKTLRELVEEHKTAKSFNDWLKSIKTLYEIDEKDRKKAVEEGTLITRAYVKEHIFGLVDGTFRRLLTDVPRTITGRTYEATQAGRSKEEITTIVEQVISDSLKSFQREVETAVKNAK